jgi:Electron transfer DM13
MKKWKVVIPVIIMVLSVGWYWFRPERLFIDRRVDEAFPTSNDSPVQILESGTFHTGTHPTEGTATIYRVENGSRILRFTNFKTSNGPDVHVYMVAAEDARDSTSVQHATFIDLGVIKGNIGNQNYILGSDVDLAKYRTVSVWCKRFNKNFGAAPLTPQNTTSQNPVPGLAMRATFRRQPAPQTVPCVASPGRGMRRAGRCAALLYLPSPSDL